MSPKEREALKVKSLSLYTPALEVMLKPAAHRRLELKSSLDQKLPCVDYDPSTQSSGGPWVGEKVDPGESAEVPMKGGSVGTSSQPHAWSHSPRALQSLGKECPLGLGLCPHPLSSL